MTGFCFHRWITTLADRRLWQACLSVGILLFSIAVYADNKSVLIIKSNENSFFNSSIEQLILHTPQVQFQIVTLDTLHSDDSALLSAGCVITFGLDAANFTIHRTQKKPVIHTYLTEFQLQQHADSLQHYIILLDQPLQRYLTFIKLLLGSKKIGLIKNKSTALDPERIQDLNQSLDIQLEQRLFSVGDNPINMVRDLLQKNDVLLSLPEPDVYNRNTLKGILLTSYRQNKPVISYSPSQVKSGALAAIYSSPENIGRQTAALLNKILDDNSFQPQGVYFSSEFDIKFNPNVARSLGLQLPDKEELLQKLKQDQSE
ncbi:MAG: hypothetical protein H8E21_06505 [Gammaproteobacteria bacterium]|nr:hypothetical protein [Gammaproteobacteria bacterium]